MNGMIIKNSFILFLYIISFNLQGQNLSEKDIYIVITENLNVRNQPKLESDIVHQVHLNDTIDVKNIVNNWYQIAYIENFENILTGYVHKDYVKKITKSNGEKVKVKEEQDLGFKSGFIYYGIRSFGLLLFASFVYYNYKTRTKDARFSGGYRGKDIDFLSFIKYAFYSLIISIPIALIAGIICFFA
jgi:hypothetical protein